MGEGHSGSHDNVLYLKIMLKLMEKLWWIRMMWMKNTRNLVDGLEEDDVGRGTSQELWGHGYEECQWIGCDINHHHHDVWGKGELTYAEKYLVQKLKATIGLLGLLGFWFWGGVEEYENWRYGGGRCSQLWTFFFHVFEKDNVVY